MRNRPARRSKRPKRTCREGPLSKKWRTVYRTARATAATSDGSPEARWSMSSKRPCSSFLWAAPAKFSALPSVSYRAVYGRRPAGVRPLSEVKEEISRVLAEERRQKALEDYLDALRAKSRDQSGENDGMNTHPSAPPPPPCCVPSKARQMQLNLSRSAAQERERAIAGSTDGMVSLDGGRFLMGTESAEAFPADGEGPCAR